MRVEIEQKFPNAPGDGWIVVAVFDSILPERNRLRACALLLELEMQHLDAPEDLFRVREYPDQWEDEEDLDDRIAGTF